MSGLTMRWPEALTPRRIAQLWYAPLLALAMGLMMLRLLVIARVLPVESFAEFSAGLLVSGTFCMLGCLGLQAMLQREWPVHLVRRQERRALVRAWQCNLVALACALAGLLFAATGVSPAGIAPALLAVGVVHGVSQQFFLVATVESRSRGDAVRFARQNLARAAAVLCLSVGVAAWTGSAMAALAIDALLSFALSSGYLRASLRRGRLGTVAVHRLAMRRLRRVDWRQALTLTIIMIVGFLLLNSDRWVAADRLATRGFAVYSFAWIVLSIAQSVQVVINASVYPMVARRFAEHGRGVAFDVSRRASLAILAAGALVALPGGYILALLVPRWFPQYADAVALLPLFLAVGVLRVSDFWSGFLLITGHEGRLLRLNLAAAVAAFAVWSLAVRPWDGAAITPVQVAWLAGLLTLCAYAAAAGASWRARLP
jgi:O-antigen/teichoic acid export membrane protein